MKFYLSFALFSLYILCFPIFSQEDIHYSNSPVTETSSTHPALSEEYLVEQELKNNLHPNETQPSWGGHMERESESFQNKFFHMLFILTLLIGFMILASWAIKRMMRSKMSHLNSSGNIKILETRYLSPRATLYLIEVKNQTFLIAESPTCVASLASLQQKLEEPSSPLD